MATIQVSIDDNIKKRADIFFSSLGLDMQTAVNIFVRQSLRQGRIPFEIYDPFYSAKNQTELRKRIDEIESGAAKLTVHELVEIDDE